MRVLLLSGWLPCFSPGHCLFVRRGVALYQQALHITKQLLFNMRRRSHVLIENVIYFIVVCMFYIKCTVDIIFL